MPPKAHKGYKNGPIVEAGKCRIVDVNESFYCITEGCNAEMTIVSAGNPEDAYFRRNPSSPLHISPSCSKCSIAFRDSDYDENKFDKVKAFEWMFGISSIKRGGSGTVKGEKGGGRPPVRTLGTLYSMCINKEKSDFYNGVLIDDLFADAENYNRYSKGMEGYLFVECSFYKKAYKEFALIMNYPVDFKKPHGHVKIIFKDEKKFWKQYNKLKNNNHIEPIVIAGNWKKVTENKEYQSECTIYSDRQIYYVKFK